MINSFQIALNANRSTDFSRYKMMGPRYFFRTLFNITPTLSEASLAKWPGNTTV
jgi:hypothetical protein